MNTQCRTDKTQSSRALRKESHGFLTPSPKILLANVQDSGKNQDWLCDLWRQLATFAHANDWLFLTRLWGLSLWVSP
jgi:hypothetical protein